MNALAQRIVEHIQSQGPISIAEFMTLCLHDPDYGAYASRSPIGAGGDYVTSPEISQTFGEMCGLWIVQSWHNQGRPQAPVLVELGPGRGTMMKDVLRAIQAAARKFFVDAEIVLVEASPVLRAQQEKLLQDAPAHVSWVGSLDDLATDRPIYLLANEFFDCLPIRQFVNTAQGWCEKVITVKDGELALALKRLAAPEAVLPADILASAPENGVYESCPAAAAICEDIARTVSTRGGTALIFDYGYAATPYKETLQSVQRHKYADVLSAPGTSDLSAHVDFSALKRAAVAGGALATGPIDQGDFLAALGIEVRARNLLMANPNAAKQIVAGVKRLIDPADMGSLFKVLALTARDAPPPPGFSDEEIS